MIVSAAIVMERSTAMQTTEQDSLQKFIFEKHQVKGAIIRLDASYREAWRLHSYELPVRKLLGEALASVCLLSSTIKFKGRISLQAQGDGLLPLLLVQSDEGLHVRGLSIAKGETKNANYKALLGEGSLMISIDQDNTTERYQGLTKIQGDALSETLEHYFEQSEQLPTRLWLFANEQEVVGLLLQQMPDVGDQSVFWEHVTTLAETITEDELMQLQNVEILHRLFHEEDVRIFESDVVSFRCQCSVEKMTSVLEGLGEKEAQSILDEQGSISINCDFCNKQYQFDAVDVAQIFAAGAKPRNKQDEAKH
jgi:molecular chaperone Hsp33